MNKILQNDIENLVKNNLIGDSFDEKTILITGANGLIAKYFTLYFLMYNRIHHTKIHVIALIRNKEKAQESYQDFISDPYFKLLIQDVCDPLVYEGKVDYIFHAAGNASAHAIRTNPIGIIKANLIGTLNVLDFAKEHHVTKVVFPSTREIYGKTENIDLISETDMGVLDPLESRNCYPESKRMAENILKSYSIQHNIPFNIIRIAHTYGPGMTLANDGRVMSDLINFVVNSQDVILNSDGTAIRTFCYVTDAISGILKIMKDGEENEAYNLSNNKEPLMIRDLAKKLIRLSNKNIQLGYKEASQEIKNGYTSYKIIHMNNSKLESLGWNPQISLDEGLAKTLQYFDEELASVRKR